MSDDINALLNDISQKLLETQNLEHTLQWATEKLGEHFQTERCFIFKYDASNNTIHNAYEWCANGIREYVHELQQLPLTQFPWLNDQLQAMKTITIADVNALPEAAANMKYELLREGVCSQMVTPIHAEQKLLGFIGFDGVRHPIAWDDSHKLALESVATQIAERWHQQAASIQDKKYYQQLSYLFLKVIHALSRTIAERDPFSAQHQLRTAALARAIAKKLRLPNKEIDGIYVASLLHDVGKICIPSDILSQPRELTKEEWKIVHKHPQYGSDMLSHIQFPWPVPEMIAQHHERLDGSGFPLGLQDKEINLGARIIAVADEFEAMTSDRAQRPKKSQAEAIKILQAQAGIQLDKKVVDACIELFNQNVFDFPHDDQLTLFL